MADHEGCFGGGEVLGGDDEVAFIFAGRGVEDNDERARGCEVAGEDQQDVWVSLGGECMGTYLIWEKETMVVLTKGLNCVLYAVESRFLEPVHGRVDQRLICDFGWLKALGTKKPNRHRRQAVCRRRW